MHMRTLARTSRAHWWSTLVGHTTRVPPSGISREHSSGGGGGIGACAAAPADGPPLALAVLRGAARRVVDCGVDCGVEWHGAGRRQIAGVEVWRPMSTSSMEARHRLQCLLLYTHDATPAVQPPTPATPHTFLTPAAPLPLPDPLPHPLSSPPHPQS
eukprot:352078-Chlamydomonas_euryale.AAC.2